MRNHVQVELSKSDKFKSLAKREPESADIIANISQHASGVWLWVTFVTRNILLEVNKNEGVTTPRRIVDEFPADLEECFKLIIDGVKERHQEEMAQIFLVTVHELQPLPLYAFPLLKEERNHPGHVLRVSSLTGWMLSTATMPAESKTTGPTRGTLSKPEVRTSIEKASNVTFWHWLCKRD
jgi:hypothetical protein